MTTRSPVGRYGTRRSPRIFYAVGAALLLAVTVIAVLLGRHASTLAVSSGVRAFTTHERSVTITFEVRKRAAAAAVCILRARDRDGAEVGRREVAVPARPDGQRTSVLSETVTTTGRPVTGELYSCHITG